MTLPESFAHLHSTVQVWGAFLDIAKPMSVFVTGSKLA
jgi:hypothetical protein